MQVKKSIKIPIHSDTAKSKISIQENPTARLTYAIRLISELSTDDTKIDRKTIRSLVKESDVDIPLNPAQYHLNQQL